jgi:hypothetical protein
MKKTMLIAWKSGGTIDRYEEAPDDPDATPARDAADDAHRL